MESYHEENWYTLDSVDSLKRIDVIKHPPMRVMLRCCTGMPDVW